MDADEAFQVPPDPKSLEAKDTVTSSHDMLKWSEMMDADISQYMRHYPDRFHRRVRRGIPSRFRWQVWKAAVHFQEYEMPVDFRDLSHRRNDWTHAIETDIGRTFPELEAFDDCQQQRLLRVLNAYASYNPEVGYCQGMNFVAGLLLLVSDHEEESFGVLVCLMDRLKLSGFYSRTLPLLRRYLRACDRLVADTVPELREHFIQENVQPAMYLHQWFLTLFINCFPLSMIMIIWDVIICEGLPVILRIAVAILQVLKDSLLSMHFEEIIKFFKMMKTCEDEDGELDPFRIGQLLMKHTDHVVIPERVLEYLSREPFDDETTLDSDESWEADISSTSWFHSFSRMFAFGSTRRRVSSADNHLASGSASPSCRATETQVEAHPAEAGAMASPRRPSLRYATAPVESGSVRSRATKQPEAKRELRIGRDKAPTTERTVGVALPAWTATPEATEAFLASVVGGCGGARGK
eukprot:TRINITY_DN67844_c0_g1_i1.p1 TRINITY_DN67844_c0_g1~~TRINITY_DN67844_c0_g1_i1.p1  ORF type:complete len:466 (-),score=77.97 TRINITY_DN67844_c0_g1_i1:76-1473(-)